MGTTTMPKGEARKVLGLLNKIRDTVGDIPIQQLQLLLVVALHDGESQQEIQKYSKQSRASTSRNLQAWSSLTRTHQPGPAYIEMRQDPYERRRNMIYVTPQGWRFLEELFEKPSSTGGKA